MRNFLALLGAGTLTFVGLGWYLDWYKVIRQPSPAAGTQRLAIDLNPQKIGSDVVTGIKRGGELIEHLSEKDSTPAPPKLTEDVQKPPEAPATSREESGWFTIPHTTTPPSNIQQTKWKSLDTMPVKPR